MQVNPEQKQAVFARHADSLYCGPGVNVDHVIAHLLACRLVLLDEFDEYQRHCVANGIGWHESWLTPSL